MSSLTLPELEQAASAVIHILKSIPEISHARIAVIGGMAVMKYAQGYRTTTDVDFLITAAGAPQSVKAKLLALPNTPFEQRAQIFLYKAPSGKAIQIDMTPDWQSPYVPDAARPVNSISGALPYISPVDLLVFKINSCGLRPTGSKKTRDAADAVVLLTRLSHNGPLTLTTNQKNATTQGLKDVVQWSGRDEGWWKSKLGLN